MVATERKPVPGLIDNQAFLSYDCEVRGPVEILEGVSVGFLVAGHFLAFVLRLKFGSKRLKTRFNNNLEVLRTERIV